MFMYLQYAFVKCRTRHSENFHMYSTPRYEQILGVFVNKIALSEVRKSEMLSS